MDRDRFKRKPDEGVVSQATPQRRPVQAGEISPPRLHAVPAHHPKPPVHVPNPVPAASARPAPVVQQPIPELMNQPVELPATDERPAKSSKKLSKKRIAEIALVAILLVGVGGFLLLNKPDKEDLTKGSAAVSGLHVSANGAAANSTTSVAGTVPFTPVVPRDKPQLAKLGSTAYNSQYKSYTFDDTFMSQKLRVSQQELPSGQDNASGLIDKIGASLKAQSVTPISIQSGQPTYLLNNTSKAGSQVAVFSAKGKLMFIQAATAFDASIWPDYLNTFE